MVTHGPFSFRSGLGNFGISATQPVVKAVKSQISSTVFILAAVIEGGVEALRDSTVS